MPERLRVAVLCLALAGVGVTRGCLRAPVGLMGPAPVPLVLEVGWTDAPGLGTPSQRDARWPPDQRKDPER